MDEEPSRKRKADESAEKSNVKVETRDMACSPIPELVSPEVSPAPASESIVSVTTVAREPLPRIKMVDSNRPAKKTVKMDFVATQSIFGITYSAQLVEVHVYLAEMDWVVSLKKATSESLEIGWKTDTKIYANQWRMLATLTLVLSDPDDPTKKARFCKPGAVFDSSVGGCQWKSKDLTDDWRSLVAVPLEGQLIPLHTTLDVQLELTIEHIYGFRLLHSFSYNFSEPNKDSDLVFKFGENDVHINCNLLSFHSDYFHATKDRLSTMKKNENGFPYEEMDVNMDEFIELMEIVYPSRRKITDENVAYILPLADRFLFDGVMRECEQFLVKSSQIDVFLKLLWSSEYTMNGLQDWCLSQFKTRKEISKVKQSELYDKLKKTAHIMTALFEKSTDLPG